MLFLMFLKGSWGWKHLAAERALEGTLLVVLHVQLELVG